MNIRLIVSDLDGTMLDDMYRIPEENKNAVKEAMDAGIEVTIATGRMYSSARAYADELGITLPIITYNGAVIKTAQGELLSCDFIEEKTVTRVLEFCFSGNHYVQLYSEGEYYYAVQTEAARHYEKASGIFGHAVGQDGLLSRTKNVEKLLIVAKTPKEADDIAYHLNVNFGTGIAAVKSTDYYVEVIYPTVSKAKALLTVAKKYGFVREEIMAIGDSDNDISMLETVGTPVAVANANEWVKDKAKYTTKADNNEGGVAEAIRRFALANGK